MLFDGLLLAIFLAAGVYVLTNAQRLASRPRRGTEARPTERVWIVVGAFLLVGALGALINILSG